MMPGSTRTRLDRVTRARELLRAPHLDALLVQKGENRRYVTGFTGSAGLALLTATDAWLAVDFRYEEQAESEASGWGIIRGGRDPLGALAATLRDRALGSIGFESEFVPYAQVERLREKLAPAELVPVAGVDQIRWIKDQDEIAAIARAAEIADAAYARLCEQLRPGLSERAAALELEIMMRRMGAERLAFETVLASGPRSALPHGRATDREIGADELVTLDFGSVWGGYCSDCTRTVVLGHAGERQRRVHDVATEALAASLDMIRPGVRCRDVDAHARAVIGAAGFGDAFGHSLGHGVGLDVHEGPRLSPQEDAVIEAGMVLTVEPGIYLPGWGGVRVEELVVVTEDGCRVLTHARRDFELRMA
jgi:Xaa-Pro aminopeptidase